MLSNIEAVIFDIDGTLMDSIGRIVESMTLACTASKIPVPSEEACKNIIGLTLREAVDTLVPESHKDKVDEIVANYKKTYVELELANPVKLFEDAIPTLELLKSKGIKIGIATGKSRQGYKRVSEYANLKSYVDASVTGDEYKSKPDPEMLIACADMLKLPIDKCLMVGDSALDIAMGNNAGMLTAAVLTGVHTAEKLHENHPTIIVNSLENLAKYFNR